MATPPEEQMVGTRIGSYRVIRPLGSGGTGVVFAAVHEHIGQPVAIKVLHPEIAARPLTRRRFFDEARATGGVRHPGLARIFDLGQLPDGTPYILMELLEGQSLRQRLSETGAPLQVRDALRLARQIASTLEAVHEQGIIHRDLKPENVFIVAEPEAPGGERAKVLDFGLAKVLADPDPGLADAGGGLRTRSGAVLGTPVYMSPEQCHGGGEVDDRTDVYALGVILYEMLVGHPPFSGTGTGEVLAKHIYETPAPLRARAPAVPAEVAALVHAMLAKAPGDRPAIREVAGTLKDLDLPAAVPVPQPAERAPLVPMATNMDTLGDRGAARQVARRPPVRLVVGLAALALAALGGLGGLVAVPRRSPAPPPAGPVREAVPRDAPPPSQGPQEEATASMAASRRPAVPAVSRPAVVLPRRSPGAPARRQEAIPAPPLPAAPAAARPLVEDHEVEFFE